MMHHRWFRCGILGALALSVGISLASTFVHADPEPIVAESAPEVLTRVAAVQFALRNNPEIASIRQQHGIAAAAVVIADTYPFNPVWEAKVRAAEGPISAGI